MRFLKAARSASLAVVSFAITAAILGLFTEPGSQPFHEINVLLGQTQNYDTLFFGSSQVNNQIDVQLFDQLNKAQGCRTTSWNMGAPGEDLLAINDMLQRILHSSSSTHLSTVIFEPYHVVIIP